MQVRTSGVYPLTSGVYPPCRYVAMQGAHAVLVLTEWDEFARLDFQR